MKRNNLKLLGGAAVASLFAFPAMAQNTASGTQINNQASVSYSVGGQAGSSNSNTASFLVDKKVNLAVAAVGSYTRVAVGSTDQVTTFTVTNLTNSVQDFRLVADQQTVSIPLLGTDDFNVTNMRVYVDSNGNGTYDAGVDTATYIDELAPDATKTVFIVANIPNAANQHVALVGLDAIVAAGGSSGSLGADLQATSLLTADNPNAVDVVFADDSNLLDQLRDGQQWAFNAYVIDSASVTMTKTARVISDPYNLLVNPKAIPGATVEFCMVVSNAGPGTATGVTLTDNIPANMTYVAGSLNYGGLAVGGQCVLNGISGGSFDGTKVTMPIGSILANLSVAVAFRATIN